MKNNIASLRRGILTQAELADQVGIARSYLSDIERGVSDPSARIAKRICEVLGKPFEVVFGDQSIESLSAEGEPES